MHIVFFHTVSFSRFYWKSKENDLFFYNKRRKSWMNSLEFWKRRSLPVSYCRSSGCTRNMRTASSHPAFAGSGTSAGCPAGWQSYWQSSSAVNGPRRRTSGTCLCHFLACPGNFPAVQHTSNLWRTGSLYHQPYQNRYVSDGSVCYGCEWSGSCAAIA